MARRKSDNHRMANGLTPQQFNFTVAYFRGLTVADAAAKVGYRSVNHGYNTLNKPHVRAVLEDLRAGRIGTVEIAMLRRDAIEELKAIAFSDIREMLQPAEIMQADGTVISTFVPADPQTWSDETAGAVSKLKFFPADKGGGIAEISLWSKMDAIKQLGLLIGEDALDALEVPHEDATPTVRRFSAAKDITPDDEEPDDD